MVDSTRYNNNPSVFTIIACPIMILVLIKAAFVILQLICVMKRL